MRQDGYKATDDDRRLALACARGDVEAWKTLIEHMQVPIAHLVTRLLGPQEVEDVTQEVFLRAFRAMPAFRGDCRLSTWIYRIALNLCRDRARRNSRRPALFSLDEPLLTEDGEVRWQLADAQPAPDEQIQHIELEDRVAEALAMLPDIHRSVLVLHDMQGLRYEEVAQILGCSLGTVKSRIFYARRKLARILEDYMVC